MDGTTIQQGRFISDGNPRIIPIRSGANWIQICNLSTIGTNPNPGVMQSAYWQSEFTAGSAIFAVNTDGAATLQYDTSAVGDGITLFDSSTMAPGAPIAVTAGTDATRPVYSTGDTGTLGNGGIVRVVGTAHTNLNGLDFSVDTLVVNTSFRLANTIATTPGAIAGAAGFWRYLAPDITVYKLFYPSNRNLANVTSAAAGVVTTLVDHGYAIGDVVRFTVPAVYGMIELDGLTATITAVTASTFTTNIDTTAFTAFQFPLPAISPFTPASVVPVGGDQTQTFNLTSAELNQGIIGVLFGADLVGVNTDVITWRAGSSVYL